MLLNQTRRLINRSFQTLLLLLLCSLISGCQTTIMSNIRTDYDFGNNNKDTGLIIGTVSHPEYTDDITFSTFHINYYTGHPKSILSFRERSLFYSGHSAEFEFEDAGNKGKLFVLELPAGEHTVDHWEIQYGFGGWYPKSAPSPLEFKIQSDEILYLGNFHMQTTIGKFWVGEVQDGGFPVINDERERDIQLFREIYPDLSSRNIKLNVLHEGHWTNELNKSDELTVPKLKEKSI